MSSRHGIISQLKLKKILEAVRSKKRLDGRGLEDYRSFTVSTNVIEKAEGSAEVFLGETRVLAGVKIDYGKPFEDTPDEGVLICNAEFVPIASPIFEPGPPGEDSIELARVVDRGLRSAEAVDFSKLAIVPGKNVYLVHVDLYILNYAGNLIDASAIASVAALKTAMKPIYRVDGDEIISTGENEALGLNKMPVAVTMVKIGDSFVIDPSADEEEVMGCRLTVTLDDDGNVCTIQKSGSEGLTTGDIQKAVNTASERAPQIRSAIMEFC